MLKSCQRVQSLPRQKSHVESVDMDMDVDVDVDIPNALNTYFYQLLSLAQL